MEGSGLEDEVDEMVRESLFRVVMFKQTLNLRELAPQGQGWESTIAKAQGWGQNIKVSGDRVGEQMGEMTDDELPAVTLTSTWTPSQRWAVREDNRRAPNDSFYKC